MNTLLVNNNWMMGTIFKMFSKYGPNLPLATPICYEDINEKEVINLFYNAVEGLVGTTSIDFKDFFETVANYLGFRVNSCEITKEYNEEEDFDCYILNYSIEADEKITTRQYNGYVEFFDW